MQKLRAVSSAEYKDLGNTSKPTKIPTTHQRETKEHIEQVFLGGGTRGFLTLGKTV